MSLNDLLEEVNSKDTFLCYALAWGRATSAITDKPMVPEQPSWKLFAEMLTMGKHYE